MTRVTGILRLMRQAAPVAAALVLSTLATAQTPSVVLEFERVPIDEQSGGPDYEYLIGVYEVRNDQYVAFLNDALLNLDNERGYFLYFDLDSGDVYVNTNQTGTTGIHGSGSLVFDASANPFVSYDSELEVYVIEPGGEEHPVTGVTWYGAVKFCNWFSLAIGLAPEERAYNEAPSTNLAGWRPVTSTDAEWAAGDLTDQQRSDLLGKLGFRLPMDGGSGGNPGSYNEWYKAAAWDAEAGVHRVYGFGRDGIGPPDANYECSGDPFEDPDDCSDGGTTPAGFYDGNNSTADTENMYGLYDVSGNVWEWMQDQSPSDPAKRRFRGGSWTSPATRLAVDGVFSGQTEHAGDNKGFRVAQHAADGFYVTDFEVRIEATWGGPFEEPHEPGDVTFRVHNVSASEMTFDIAIEFDVPATEPWIVLVDSIVVPGEATAEVTAPITWGCEQSGLTVGDNIATVTFTRQPDALQVVRVVTLTITEPLEITGNDLHADMLFASDPTPAETTYTLSSDSDTPVRWDPSIEFDPPDDGAWLVISPEPEPEVPPQGEGEATLRVVINQAVSATLAPGTHEATVKIEDKCTGQVFERSASLFVNVPYSIEHADGVESTGVWGGPFDPGAHVFTIERGTDVSVGWSAELDPPPPATEWLELDITEGILDDKTPSVEVTASFTSAAASLDLGTHEVILKFVEDTTGFEIERTVAVEVFDFVTPAEGVRFSGPLGGPFAPSGTSYTLRNLAPFAEIEIQIEVTYDPGDSQWLDVPSKPVLLLNPPDDAESIPITLSAVAETLPARTYTAVIHFERDGVPDIVSTRTITLEVGIEAFSVKMSKVPEEHIQPLGPEHLFRIGKYEVTNAEFVRFLTDTKRNPTHPRGEYMNHQTDLGIVTLPGDATYLFDASEGGAIAYVGDGDQYIVTDDAKKNLPVIGVSWYGALKFCNWMTLIQLMDEEQRAYQEGDFADQWYAAVTGATPDDDLTDEQRGTLLGKRGFRLPMDHQTDTESFYNEWYKAAAWRDGPRDNAVYGFGRDTLTNADANYLNSGDPFEGDVPALSPVGFFDGVNTLQGGAPTNDTANGYGLYDVTGNVTEWMQDFGDSSSERVTRGGHSNNAHGSVMLRADNRVSRPADATLSFVGFRVAQVFVPDGLNVTQGPVRIDGPVGGEYSESDAYLLYIENRSSVHAVDDFTITIDVGWLEIDGVPPQLIPPDSPPMPVRLRPSLDPAVLGISPAPPGDFALVRSSDDQPDGPEYDYWISRTEVTNSEFADFLNDARANASGESPDGRSEYMYFDLDSGSVYINDQQAGEEGVELPADTTFLYDTDTGRIHLVDDTYTPEAGFASHPVVGVTWYGALKYCNWLTIREGLPADMRAYREAPSSALGEWRPVTDTASDLITRTIGYRLPMDDAANGASAYNEWYKATAWDPLEGDSGGNHVYGFGRDEFNESDANYADSTDTDEEGTTPVRFFDGVNALYGVFTVCPPTPPNVTLTENTDNSYGLYDACGNVAEWTQDVVVDALEERATRGGSWRDEEGSLLLRNDGRGSQPADSPSDDTGFRIVRGTGHIATVTVTDNLADVTHEVHFILDLREPFKTEPLAGVQEGGTYRDWHPEAFAPYTVWNQSASPMEWQVSTDRSWLDAAQDGSDGTTGGRLDAGILLWVSVELNEEAELLGPGTHVATLDLRNATTGQSTQRSVTLTIDQPISVAPCGPDPFEFPALWGGPFESLDPCTYELTNDVLFDLQYSVSADQPWITIEPADGLAGSLPIGGSLPFDVSLNEAANELDVGEYEATVSFAFIDPGNEDLTSSIEKTVKLTVEEPIDIAPADGVSLPPDPATSQDFTLTNSLSTPINVSISVDVNWLDLDATEVEVEPGQQAVVTASPNDQVFSLPDGVYFAAVTFYDHATEYTHCRTITVSIDENLFILPYEGFVTSGVRGGPISPAAKTYTLTNAGSGAINWEVSVQYGDPDGPAWISISGADQSEDIEEGESVMVFISIDASQTGKLDVENQATIEFLDVTHDEVFTRNVLLSLVVPKFDDPTETRIPGDTQQPGGPTYTYLMSGLLTTNAQFAAFLNDAMANPNNERGQYMFFDTSTGDAYVNYTIAGGVGPDPGPRETKMFSPGVAGQIVYVDLPDPSYDIVTDPIDYSQHPVTGVSWYGALKFCNWLTLDQGMLPDRRCYSEATDAAGATGWHPIVISTSDWSNRDLTDAERLQLVADYRGYRLPMDDGSNNSTPSIDQPDGYNEWYKAAAWDPNAGVSRTYGFGRDVIEDVDANFRCSQDPFEDDIDCTLGEPTPVGFYDGTSVLADGSVTRDTDNAFGLYDMTGNAYQWMQGYWALPSGQDRRTLRGGSFNALIEAASLQTDGRDMFINPRATHVEVGLRVLRTLPVPTGDFDRDGDVDAVDFAEMAEHLVNPGGGVLPDWTVFDFDADNDIDLADFARFQQLFDGPP